MSIKEFIEIYLSHFGNRDDLSIARIANQIRHTDVLDNLSSRAFEVLTAIIVKKNVKFIIYHNYGCFYQEPKVDYLSSMVNARFKRKETSLFHELGHALDHNFINRSEYWASFEQKLDENGSTLDKILRTEMTKNKNILIERVMKEFELTLTKEFGIGTYEKFLQAAEDFEAYKVADRFMRTQIRSIKNKDEFAPDEKLIQSLDAKIAKGREARKYIDEIRKNENLKQIGDNHGIEFDAYSYYKTFRYPYLFPNHSKSYYKIKKENLAAEFFANLFDAIIRQDYVLLKNAHDVLPNSVKYGIDLINILLEKDLNLTIKIEGFYL